MDWNALKAACLRFSMLMVFFAIVIAATFALTVGVSMIPGVGETYARIGLAVVLLVFLLRSMYQDAKDDEDSEDDDSE